MEEEEDGRQADADEAIYSGTEGGKCAEPGGATNNTGGKLLGRRAGSRERQEQQCKVSVVAGGTTEPCCDWISVLRARRRSNLKLS